MTTLYDLLYNLILPIFGDPSDFVATVEGLGQINIFYIMFWGLVCYIVLWLFVYLPFSLIRKLIRSKKKVL